MRSEGLLIQRLDMHKQMFYDQAVRLEVLSPLKTLARGYSIATHGSARSVVLDAASLTIGEQLRVTFHHGEAGCRVESLVTGNT